MTPPPQPARLSRRAWLRRELAGEQLRARLERRQHAKRQREHGAVWSAGRDEWMIRHRAKVRPLIEGRAARARAEWQRLQLDPATAHFAIAIKRLCDARGWSLADLAAQRVLAMLVFLMSLATPVCWNARWARPAQRRGRMQPVGELVIGGGRGARKYTPCVRGVTQSFLRTVLAWPGDSPDDDRRCSRKTVERATRALESVGIIDAVQVPPHAAEPWEIGDSGYVIQHYWLADQGSPKPALSGLWDVDGVAVGLAELGAPWVGQTPRPNSNAPPPPSS